MTNNVELFNHLSEKVNSYQRDLSKWLIGLSTGVIVFSVKLISPNTTTLWKIILILGLGILLISIMVGVKYTATIIDYFRENLNKLTFTESLDSYNSRNPDEEHIFGEKRQKVQVTIVFLKDSIKNIEKNIKEHQSIMRTCFRCQQSCFYIGLVLVTLFAVFNL